MPENSKFIEPSSNSVTLHLPTWKDGSCRMSHFVVEHKKKYIFFHQILSLNECNIYLIPENKFNFRDHIEWNQISNNVKPGGNFVVLDLEPATWYNVRITAHNSAGFTVAEYEFATLTVTGGICFLFKIDIRFWKNVHDEIVQTDHKIIETIYKIKNRNSYFLYIFHNDLKNCSLQTYAEHK